MLARRMIFAGTPQDDRFMAEAPARDGQHESQDRRSMPSRPDRLWHEPQLQAPDFDSGEDDGATAAQHLGSD